MVNKASSLPSDAASQSRPITPSPAAKSGNAWGRADRSAAGLLWPAGKRRLRGTKARRSRPGFPTGLPRCGEVWALREDSIGCEAYTRSEVIPVCAASEVRYQGYLLCLREPVEGVHYHQCWPVRLSRPSRSCQSGRTSAPIMPHLVQTAFGHSSRIAVSSGHRSASTVALWWQSPVAQ